MIDDGITFNFETLEVSDPIKYMKLYKQFPCDPMWIGRTRYKGKEKEIFELAKELEIESGFGSNYWIKIS